MSEFKNLEHPIDRINRIQREIDNPTRNWGTGYIAEVMLDYARDYHRAQLKANEESTIHDKALDIDLVSESCKLVQDMVTDSKMWYEEFGEPENGEYKASFVDGEGFLKKYSR